MLQNIKLMFAVGVAIMLVVTVSVVMLFQNGGNSGGSQQDVTGTIDENNVSEEWGDLHIKKIGLFIHAPRSEIQRYINAPDEAAREQVLGELVSNPNYFVEQSNVEPGSYLPVGWPLLFPVNR